MIGGMFCSYCAANQLDFCCIFLVFVFFFPLLCSLVSNTKLHVELILINNCVFLLPQLFSPDTVMAFVPRYSLVLELGEKGAYKRSFHDPNGEVATFISEAHEHDGYLYLGSFRSPFICRLNLKDV